MATPRRQSSRLQSSGADLLSCSVCMEQFDDNIRQAKLLPCHHSFCRECLYQLAANSDHIDCPSCRQRIHINGPDGISALQTNFYVTQMRDLLQDQPSSRITLCRKHGNQPYSFFCKSCEVPICDKCVSTNHRETAGHMILDLDSALQEYQQALNVDLTNAREIVVSYTNLAKSFEIEAETLFAAKMTAELNIDKQFDEYVEKINVRRQQLKTHLKDLYRYKREQIQSNVIEMEKMVSSMNTLIEFCEEAYHGENIIDILTLQTKLNSKNLDMKPDQTDLEIGNNFIMYDAEDAELFDMIEDLGSVQCCDALPRKITLNEPIQATAGLYTSIKLEADIENTNMSCISVRVTDINDDELSCTLRPIGGGQFEAMFRPHMSGIHIAQGLFLGHPVSGARCAFNVFSNNPVCRIGDKGFGPGEMEFPRAVATDNDNNMYIVDSGNSRILKYDRNGHFMYHFPVVARDRSSSCGIIIDQTRNTIICPEVNMQEADFSDSNTLLFYTLNGELKHRLVYKDLFKQALSVALNSVGQIIVADYELNILCMFEPQGKLLRRLGGSGTEPGQFNHPTFVCIGDNDNIIVSDGDNNRIQVFDKVGRFMYQFGSKGSGKGQFLLPFGVTADKYGNILVVDGGNKRIQVKI